MTLSTLNDATTEQAYTLFEACCCAPNWVNKMVTSRPFNTPENLFNQAQDIWGGLEKSDYLAAFEGHPQIGDLSSLQKKYAATSATAGHEQSGMSIADQATIKKMALLNQQYLAKFGQVIN